MPAAFQPRYLPQGSPQAAPAQQSDLSSLSDQELAAIAKGGSAAPATTQAPDAGSDQSALLAQLLGGNQADAQQADFQNILALVQLLQQENTPDVAKPMDARMPATGGTTADFGGNTEESISAAGQNMQRSLAYDSIMRQRNQATLDRNPVQMMPAAARGPGLSDSLAQATSLYDLLRNRGATAAPAAGTYEPTVADRVQTSDAEMAAQRAKELLQVMFNRIKGGGDAGGGAPSQSAGNPLDFLKGLTAPNFSSLRP